MLNGGGGPGVLNFLCFLGNHFVPKTSKVQSPKPKGNILSPKCAYVGGGGVTGLRLGPKKYHFFAPFPKWGLTLYKNISSSLLFIIVHHCCSFVKLITFKTKLQPSLVITTGDDDAS